MAFWRLVMFSLLILVTLATQLGVFPGPRVTCSPRLTASMKYEYSVPWSALVSKQESQQLR